MSCGKFPVPIASSTAPPNPIRPEASVFLVELMAVDAMSRLRPSPAFHVLKMSDRLDMLRVGTAAVSTQVVSLEPSREWPNEVLIRQEVGQPKSALEPESPVPRRETSASPFPAPIFQNANPLPETQGKCSLKSHRKTRFGVVQPEVIGLAAASLYHEGSSLEF